MLDKQDTRMGRIVIHDSASCSRKAAEMSFKQGAEVVTATGTSLGTVDRVIIDARTKTMTHVIVCHGRQLTQDKVIPISLIDTTTEDQVTLREKVGDL